MPGHTLLHALLFGRRTRAFSPRGEVMELLADFRDHGILAGAGAEEIAGTLFAVALRKVALAAHRAGMTDAAEIVHDLGHADIGREIDRQTLERGEAFAIVPD